MLSETGEEKWNGGRERRKERVSQRDLSHSDEGDGIQTPREEKRKRIIIDVGMEEREWTEREEKKGEAKLLRSVLLLWRVNSFFFSFQTTSRDPLLPFSLTSFRRTEIGKKAGEVYVTVVRAEKRRRSLRYLWIGIWIYRREEFLSDERVSWVTWLLWGKGRDYHNTHSTVSTTIRRKRNDKNGSGVLVIPEEKREKIREREDKQGGTVIHSREETKTGLESERF